MKNTQTNTEINLTKMRDFIVKTFGKNIFSYKNIEGYIGTNTMLFYYFIYADVITKIRKGLYRVNDKMDKMSIREIYIAGRARLDVMRKIRIEKTKQVHPIAIPFLNFTLEEAIFELKKAGYKVMKPVQTFEEL